MINEKTAIKNNRRHQVNYFINRFGYGLKNLRPGKKHSNIKERVTFHASFNERIFHHYQMIFIIGLNLRQRLCFI